MGDELTLESFAEPPTPEAKAMRAAMAEIKDEAGKLKMRLRSEVRSLKRKRNDELVPSQQMSLDEQIAAKEQEFKDVDCIFLNATSPTQQTVQDRFKRLIGWAEIMRKHGVSGH